MPLPEWLANFNRQGTNRVTSLIAGWAPGFAIVQHRGRRSGRTYRTPVNAFPIRGGWVIALTYGADRDWGKNVIAAGGCDLETGGRLIHLTGPRLVVDPSRRPVPPVVRLMLGLLGVTEFLELALSS